MKNLKGTRTLENLMRAFSGESQARNRYTYYASVANKEGYKQIQAIFLETAENEKEHAKVFFKYLNEGLADEVPTTVEINGAYPVLLSNTLENLKAAAAGEHEEWADLYSAWGKVAEDEGFIEVANSFKFIALVEKNHETRYNKLIKNIEEGKVFEKDEKVKWICSNCGYIHEGTSALEKCPSCLHPQAYFQIFIENY